MSHPTNTGHTLQLADGRRLGWAEFGDPSGRPVLAFHGTPDCRLHYAPAHMPAAARGLRLVAPDRPGYGLSDPKPGRTLRDWSSDVAFLLDHLGIARAPILAVSGGSPYAVAVAAHLGQRITGVALVSPLGEVGGEAAKALTSRLDRALFLGLPKWSRLLAGTAAAGRAAFLAAPEMSYATFAATLSAADRRVLATPAARRIVLDMTHEAIRNGVEGALSDLDIYAQPWGLDLGSVRQPAVLWQGTADTIVPQELAFDLARRLPNCHTVRLEGHGHFWIIDHIDEVLDAVVGLTRT